MLPIENFPRWSRQEQFWFRQLCLIAALIEDLPAWSAREKAALCDLMRAKGGARERRFVRKVQQHPRFLHALAVMQSEGDALTERLTQ